MQSLDNLRALSRIDSGNMLGLLNRFPDFVAEMSRLPRSVQSGGEFDSIVMAGMGGSASAADVILDWLSPMTRVPLSVVRDSSLRRFVGARSLLLAFSYSGETRETLSAFRMGVRRGCTVAGVGSGGTLERNCNIRGLPFLPVSGGMVPRAALGLLVGAGAALLEDFGVARNLRSGLLEASRDLVTVRDLSRAEVHASRNRAKQIALGLRAHFPVVFCLQRMGSVARRAKNQFAENSKMASRLELLPEAGHNDIEAWRGNRLSMPVFVRDSVETREEARLFGAFRAGVRRVGHANFLEVRTRTVSSLGRLLGPILLFDYVSVYLALLRGLDPTPMEGIRAYRRFLDVGS